MAGTSSEVFLDAAAALGRRLTADAIWHDGCCSWVGAAVEPDDRSRPEYRPVGPLVYDGTAGIGLFLAHLAACTGEPEPARVAIGALRHALSRAGARDGFHAGTLGIAWAANEVRALLGAEELAAPADLPARAVTATRACDLVSGTAGAVVALLAVGDPAARRLGDELIERARVTRYGWSWPDPAHRRDQCGAAHGAAGVGWALLELAAATGEERFAEAARGAFAYERSWLDAGAGRWPDLRHPARRGGPHRPGMVATWCYGEAGIALSRLRAEQVLGDGPHCHDADIAVETTRRSLTSALPFAIDDLSLCHGAAGAADVLLTAGVPDAAVALGQVALERHGERGDWPCGVYGTTPGLFRGLSGIGWFFLRLHDHTIPSPLALPSAG